MMTDRMRVVRVLEWERYSWLRHGFSTRAGGVSTVYGDADLKLGFTKDDSPNAVRENRRRFVAAVAGEPDVPLTAIRQVHGTKIAIVRENPREPLEADGLMTATPGIILGVQAADCVPMLLVDLRLRVVAALHAGWRGTVPGMAARSIEKMRDEFGSAPQDIIAAVGPSIGVCCYEVGDEVRAEFDRAFGYAKELFHGRNLNLWEANRRQLLDAGLSDEAVTVLGECTGCARTGDGQRKYFSHRMEQGFTGRAMGVVGTIFEG